MTMRDFLLRMRVVVMPAAMAVNESPMPASIQVLASVPPVKGSALTGVMMVFVNPVTG